jgi:hypothetical protein
VHGKKDELADSLQPIADSAGILEEVVNEKPNRFENIYAADN